jgi:hypothetical protein
LTVVNAQLILRHTYPVAREGASVSDIEASLISKYWHTISVLVNALVLAKLIITTSALVLASISPVHAVLLPKDR